MTSASNVHILNNGYWLDTASDTSLQQASNEDFISYRGPLTLGYVKSPVWLKLHISAIPDGQPTVLRFRPTNPQEITLYDPTIGGFENAGIQRSGRATPPDSTDFDSIDLGFVIDPYPHSRDIYLRIDTPTSVIADLELLPLKKAHKEARDRAILMILYICLLLATAIWGFLHFLITRKRIFAIFFIRQIYSTIHIALLVGLYRFAFAEKLGILIGEWLYNLVIITILIPAMYFDVLLFKEFKTPKLYRNIPFVLSGLCLINLVILLFGHSGLALQLSTNLHFAAAICLLIPAFMTRVITNDPLSNVAVWILIRGGFVLSLAIVFIPILGLNNLIEYRADIVMNILILYAFVSAIQFMLLLYISQKRLENRAQKALIDERIAHSKLIEESRQRIEKENYLAMITHELRNPLAAIKLLAGSRDHVDKVHRAINDMTHIIDRVTQYQTQENNEYFTKPVKINLNSLLKELLNQHPQSSRILNPSIPLIEFTTDRELLLLILNNLIDNALKYSRRESMISIFVTALDSDGIQGVQCIVTNEIGDAGLPDESRIFQKYYRSNGAHSQIGSGLGLYLISQWAAVLDGKIAYRTFIEKSNKTMIEFALWLPIR